MCSLIPGSGVIVHICIAQIVPEIFNEIFFKSLEQFSDERSGAAAVYARDGVE